MLSNISLAFFNDDIFWENVLLNDIKRVRFNSYNLKKIDRKLLQNSAVLLFLFIMTKRIRVRRS